MEFENVDILWVESCNYPIDSGILAHRHDFFHFILVEKGEGRITVAQKEYPMREGMLFPIPAQAEHAFYNCGKEPLRTLELKFQLSDEGQAQAASLPLPMEVEGYPVREELLALYREAHAGEPMSQRANALQFELLMIHLLRCKERRAPTGAHEGKRMKLSPEIKAAVDYIHEHLTEELSLSLLAEVARFEKNYFLRNNSFVRLI